MHKSCVRPKSGPLRFDSGRNLLKSNLRAIRVLLTGLWMLFKDLRVSRDPLCCWNYVFMRIRALPRKPCSTCRRFLNGALKGSRLTIRHESARTAGRMTTASK